MFDSVRSCRPQSGVPNDEAARCEHILDGAHRVDLGVKVYNGKGLKCDVQVDQIEAGLPQGAPECLLIFTMTMDMVLRRLEPSCRKQKLMLDARRLHSGRWCEVDGDSGGDGERSNSRAGECRLVGGCRHDSLGKQRTKVRVTLACRDNVGGHAKLHSWGRW